MCCAHFFAPFFSRFWLAPLLIYVSFHLCSARIIEIGYKFQAFQAQIMQRKDNKQIINKSISNNVNRFWYSNEPICLIVSLSFFVDVWIDTYNLQAIIEFFFYDKSIANTVQINSRCNWNICTMHTRTTNDAHGKNLHEFRKLWYGYHCVKQQQIVYFSVVQRRIKICYGKWTVSQRDNNVYDQKIVTQQGKIRIRLAKKV